MSLFKYMLQYYSWTNLQQEEEEEEPIVSEDALLPEAERTSRPRDDDTRRCRYHPLRRSCSVAQWKADSPFQRLLDSGNDQALVNATGLTIFSFHKLLHVFRTYYYAYTIDDRTAQVRKLQGRTTNGGSRRKRKELPAEGALGLVLVWFRTRGSVLLSPGAGLQHFFGLSSATMTYHWLRFSRRVLLHAMQDKVDESSIKKPTAEEIDVYSNAIMMASLPGVSPDNGQQIWGAADQLKLPIPGGGCVRSVFVFAANGKIRIASLNCPGTWHHSTIFDYGVYDSLERVFLDSGGTVVIDSAFKLRNKPFLLKSSTKQQEDDSSNRAASSVRQLSEWGMRMIRAQFPRLTEPLLLEDNGEERRVILTLMTRLYNYNVSNVGMNQILNTYMREEEGNYTFFGGRMIDDDANDLFLS